MNYRIDSLDIIKEYIGSVQYLCIFTAVRISACFNAGMNTFSLRHPGQLLQKFELKHRFTPRKSKTATGIFIKCSICFNFLYDIFRIHAVSCYSQCITGTCPYTVEAAHAEASVKQVPASFDAWAPFGQIFIHSRQLRHFSLLYISCGSILCDSGL